MMGNTFISCPTKDKLIYISKFTGIKVNWVTAVQLPVLTDIHKSSFAEKSDDLNPLTQISQCSVLFLSAPILFNMDNIPVIDFGAFDSDPTAVAKAIREACETIGFFFLKNVGIPQPEIDQVFELVSPLLFLSLSLSNWLMHNIKGKGIFRTTCWTKAEIWNSSQ
jgi:hypothetical protein